MGSLTERLEIAARVHDEMTGIGNAMAATFREAAAEIMRLGAMIDAAPVADAVSSADGYPAALNGYSHDADLAIAAMIGQRVALLRVGEG